ncbi:MAG: hypothetical protein AB7Q17_09900 [Phycisphaerae bacterium]
MFPSWPRKWVPAALALFGAVPGAADPTTIDFDNLAVGTVVTTQYAGATFSAQPQSCGGSPTVNCVIVTPSGGTSSGTRALTLTTGCPDFSPDYIRVVFDEGHADVSFTLGNTAGTFNVRGYTTTAGGAAVISQNIVLTGAGFLGVHRLVRLSRPGADLRRIEIDEVNDNFEIIDDLTFDCPDSTPPIAEITGPDALACFCYGGSISGSANDPDGSLASWRLERQAVGATTWTLISVSSTPVIDALLSNWFPASSATEGYYLLRLRVTNACGLESIDETVVWLDRGFNNFEVRRPTSGQVLGGLVVVDGTAWDHCSGTLAVERRPAGGGAFAPLTNVSPPWVLNDPLGSWNTRAGVSDGDYEIRTSVTDGCVGSASITRTVTIDNTLPTAQLAAPVRCAFVDGNVVVMGTANDANLAGWSLEYAGGDVVGWAPIASSSTPVINGVLGTWNTAGLRRCAYVLRLVVTDRALLDDNGALHNQRQATLGVNLGQLGDMNCDGLVNNFDIDPFVACILAGGNCECP